MENLNGIKRECCVYCETNVTNFSRHLIRTHKNEFEVNKILALPKHSKERKLLFDDIRKRGKISLLFSVIVVAWLTRGKNKLLIEFLK